MFTTAGSTRFTIDANEFDDGIASGITKGVAPLAENDIDFIADVRPETTVPINIPTTSVSATKSAATVFSLRAQPTMPFTGSPISSTPVFLSAAASLELQSHTHPSLPIITPGFSRSCPAQDMRRKTHWPSGRAALEACLFSDLLLFDA